MTVNKMLKMHGYKKYVDPGYNLHLCNFSENLYIQEKNEFLINGTKNKLNFLCFVFFVLGQMAPYTLGPKLNYVKEK